MRETSEETTEIHDFNGGASILGEPPTVRKTTKPAPKELRKDSTSQPLTREFVTSIQLRHRKTVYRFLPTAGRPSETTTGPPTSSPESPAHIRRQGGGTMPRSGAKYTATKLWSSRDRRYVMCWRATLQLRGGHELADSSLFRSVCRQCVAS